jgi:hypothetical protein
MSARYGFGKMENEKWKIVAGPVTTVFTDISDGLDASHATVFWALVPRAH